MGLFKDLAIGTSVKADPGSLLYLRTLLEKATAREAALTAGSEVWLKAIQAGGDGLKEADAYVKAIFDFSWLSEKSRSSIPGMVEYHSKALPGNCVIFALIPERPLDASKSAHLLTECGAGIDTHEVNEGYIPTLSPDAIVQLADAILSMTELGHGWQGKLRNMGWDAFVSSTKEGGDTHRRLKDTRGKGDMQTLEQDDYRTLIYGVAAEFAKHPYGEMLNYTTHLLERYLDWCEVSLSHLNTKPT